MKEKIIKFRRFDKEELDFVKRFCLLPRKMLTEKFNIKFQREMKVAGIKGLCIRQGWAGQPRGAKPGWAGHFANPLWSERLHEGYIMIKVPEANPRTGKSPSYVRKHRWLWEQKHGKIPQGKILMFKDGDKRNCALGNLLLVDHSLNAALRWAGYPKASDECKPLIINTCHLKKMIRNRKNEKKPNY